MMELGITVELLFSWSSTPLFAEKAEYSVPYPFRCEREGNLNKHAEIIFRIYDVNQEK